MAVTYPEAVRPTAPSTKYVDRFADKRLHRFKEPIYKINKWDQNLLLKPGLPGTGKSTLAADRVEKNC